MPIRKTLAALLVVGLFGSGMLAAAEESDQEGQQAQSEPAFQEGWHYHRLPVDVEVEDPDRIEVTEVFGYACIHCYRFDPIIDEWQARLPDDVAFRRTPAVFNDTWKLLGRMFYAAQLLGVSEDVHMPLFQAIHERGLDLRRPETAERLFQLEGKVQPEDFRGAMSSFSVDTRLRQADALGRAYRVTGVPTLVVNGRYRIDIGDAGGFSGMLRIAEFLIAEERARLNASE